VRLLNEVKLPENVTVQDAGTPGWGLVEWIKDWPSVFIVDAIQMGLKPGEWQSFDAHEVSFISNQGSLSLHDTDFAGGLALAQELNLLPEQLIFYGIEPETIEQGMLLSPSVSANLPGLVSNIINKITL
jgi:hydrogenase maturation protease